MYHVEGSKDVGTVGGSPQICQSACSRGEEVGTACEDFDNNAPSCCVSERVETWMIRGVVVPGTGRRKRFSGFSGHGQNSAMKSSKENRSSFVNWPMGDSMPGKKKGNGEAHTIPFGTPDIYPPLGVGAVHCSKDGVYVSDKRILKYKGGVLV